MLVWILSTQQNALVLGLTPTKLYATSRQDNEDDQNYDSSSCNAKYIMKVESIPITSRGRASAADI